MNVPLLPQPLCIESLISGSYTWGQTSGKHRGLDSITRVGLTKAFYNEEDAHVVTLAVLSCGDAIKRPLADDFC